MSTYAIGDVQGCREQLEQLLEQIKFDPVADTLWFAGDLVNVGPDSLGTLRLIHSIKDSVVSVLGNHDLHLLAVQADHNFTNNQDTMSSLLNASDAELLLDWLRFRPLAHEEGDFFMSHAGLYPFWNSETALTLAAEVEQLLRCDNYQEFFKFMYGNKPDTWSENLIGDDRLRFITNAFTRMRYLYSDQSLNLTYKGSLAKASPDLIPWFNVTDRVTHSGFILHGHWAALKGGEPAPGIISLDTGCVWGNKLSAWCLEEKHWYSVPGLIRN